jgi:hypothetical protein
MNIHLERKKTTCGNTFSSDFIEQQTSFVEG